MANKLDQSKHKNQSKDFIESIKQNDDPWDAAIKEAKRRISDLKFSIRDFQKRKARGDKWIGAA
jgi:hypothetical protein